MIVAVDGNIGSGKSRALAALAARGRADLRVFHEPVDEWTLLSAFYADRRTTALPFQLEVLESYAGVPTLAAEPGVTTVVTERSPLTGRDVFGKLLVNDGLMSDGEWDTYNRWHRRLGWTPDAIVYVDTPPETCMRRVRSRARAAECLDDGVDRAYLDRLDRAHRVLLDHGGVPVVRVDGAADPDVVAASVAEAVDALTSAAASARSSSSGGGAMS